MIKQYFPHFLAIAYFIFTIVLGIHPVSREVWIAELTPVISVYLALVLTFRKFRFSNLSYALMFFWIFWHTIGGHYTFANVPFQWFTDLIGAQRNHFDRIGHYSVGFYAYAMAEWVTRKGYCKFKLAVFFGLFFIMSIAAAYEIIEWIYAVSEGGDAGVEFLGSQGDAWDAQKDMLADTLGAVSSLILFLFIRPDKDFERSN